MSSPNSPSHQAAIEHALQTFEAFEQRLMTLHAPDFAALDVTMAQAKLLYVVAAARELTMSEVAQRLGVTISTASGAVDHLVAAGLLARGDDPANRRQVIVSVTPAGIDNLEQLRELSQRQLRLLLEHVDDEGLAVIERATRILMAAIDAAPSPAPIESTGAPR